eukprot:13869619-Heterocapsa_arctica.AAC.1
MLRATEKAATEMLLVHVGVSQQKGGSILFGYFGPGGLHGHQCLFPHVYFGGPGEEHRSHGGIG